MKPDRTLIFDGDCAFCRTWVDYWKSRTGDAVRYLSIEKSRREFPGLAIEDLKQRVHLVTPEGIFTGAEAVFRALGSGWMVALYQRVPVFAVLAEFLYGLVAGHRGAAMKVTRALWGERVTRPTYSVASLIFTRALSFVYLFALASAGTQVRGLIGEEGILPVGPFLAAVQRQVGTVGLWRVPTLFWMGHSDFAILSICWGGVALAAISIIARPWGKWPRIIYAVLFVYYLSLVAAGQVFLGYQWDYLLLEVGFLAIFLKPERGRVWLFHLLLFRLMFESGVVKLLSHDPHWRNLTALDVYFETQPLPTVLAWYAHQLPGWFHKAGTLAMFAIELVVPFLVFGPRRMKQVAACGLALLQVLIFLTGNYTFFNVLTLALCVLLLDDAFFARWPKIKGFPAPLAGKPATAVLTALILSISAISVAGVFVKLPAPLAAIDATQATFGIVNRYGLFSVMTTTRPEIEMQGSLDGEHWLPLKFRYKVGALDKMPGWVAPLQPRLDWQMWFAALGTTRQNPWFIPFVLRLLEASKPVAALMDFGPFGGNPPKLIRAMVYEYRFTNFAEKKSSGNYWKREFKGAYFPPVGLRGTAVQ